MWNTTISIFMGRWPQRTCLWFSTSLSPAPDWCWWFSLFWNQIWNERLCEELTKVTWWCTSWHSPGATCWCCCSPSGRVSPVCCRLFHHQDDPGAALCQGCAPCWWWWCSRRGGGCWSTPWCPRNYHSRGELWPGDGGSSLGWVESWKGEDCSDWEEREDLDTHLATVYQLCSE